MFDQLLQTVKEHLGNNPEVANAIPAHQADAIHQEIATHLDNGLQSQPAIAANPGLLSQFESSLASGNILTSAITGGLVSSLASKFGLSPLVTGAIAASLPGLMQKYAQRNAAAGAGATQ
ncbi:MAG: hypothetical protein Q8927_06490 [Bacteroidota bacterium]|nr:hypothetical protein [Bacteroidota bacterium]MDP4215831.1 hypothetical protein [Bacteroidota bacterium]MDP4246562.1 hypothetical protein [Bacteroidota bacterium]MDP4255747.1 hypothetical protein [Bacteroidota bacterium]MDP4260433.1 hypothetical protein [Bacteroidota bacterium]